MPEKDNKTYDVVGLGNAIVDVLATCDDNFLEEAGMTKGVMQLVFTQEEADALYSKMPPSQETSGGSGANSIALIAELNGKTGFMGKVADDELGAVFSRDLKAAGTDFETTPLKDDVKTAKCMVIVTPDSARTMNTYLGASTEFSEEDVNKEMIAKAQILYLEGYLYDKPKAKKAFDLAAQKAQESGCKVALTLSDPFCVDRHRDDFLKIIHERVDILFANSEEVQALYPNLPLDEAFNKVANQVEIVAMTMGEKGAVIVEGGSNRVEVPAFETVLADTTGAGDAFAGGFLYAYTKGKSLEEAGQFGCACASLIVAQIGARYSGDLALALKEEKKIILEA